MRKGIVLFALYFLLTLGSATESLSQEIVFHFVSPPKENPWKLITGITQDLQGYMWFASNQGLNRYDGHNVKHYKHDPSNKNSLSNNRIECIYTDSKGFIWAGTHGYGLNRFDPINNVVTRYNNTPEEKRSLINDTVTAILEDSEKNIWIGTYGGLDRFDSETGKFIHFSYDPNDSTSLSNNHIRVLYEDKERTIWVGTGSPFINDKGVVKNEGGLNRLDKKTGKFTRYLHNAKNPLTLIDNRVRAIFEDSHGNFWVGTAGDGLHLMDRKNGIFKRHQYDPVNPGKLSRPPIRNLFPWVDDHITFIREDARGALWIGTITGGINRYDPKTQKVTFYGLHEKEIPGGFNDYSGWTAYSSRDGVLWISSLIGNLFRVDPLHRNIPYYELNEGVGTVYEDTGRTVWLGVSNGLLKVKDNKIMKRYVHDSLIPTSISHSYVNMIQKDSRGKFWISTYGGGLNYFDTKTERFIRYQNDKKNPNSLINNTVIVILQARDQNLWVGTFDGLDKMDTKTGKFVHFQHNPRDTNSLSENAIQCLLEDRLNQLWIGTGSFGGVNVFNKQTGHFRHYFKGVSILNLFEDSEGVVWICTTDDLLRFDNSKNTYTSFVDPYTGLKIKNVLSISEDNQNNLWLFCPNNIIRLNSRRNSSKTYGKDFGVKSNLLNFVKSFKGPSGNIFCGNENGYYSFVPAEVIENSSPPQIVLTDFSIRGQSIKADKFGPLKVSIASTDQIRLNYKQNNFTFDFDVLHFSNSENNQHLFRLEGYDNTWRNTGIEKKAIYFNVSPGKYTFVIKAANYVGIWTEKKIEIIITPPWWQRWWFFITALIFLIAIVYLIIKLRVKAVRKTERIKAQYEKELLEFEARALRAQMNPHFIFNCMNSIKALIQSDEKQRSIEYLTTFSKLIRTLFQNSDKRQISLFDEVETCRLYTQLEAMRLKGKLNYNFIIDPNVDLKSVMVPALIIQPFIENAIWHGIVPKDEGTIKVSIKQNENVIVCEVDDDGIGRELSKLNKPVTPVIHESKGVHLSQARIDLEKKLNDTNASIETIDRYDNGQPAGTKVIITFNIQ